VAPGPLAPTSCASNFSLAEHEIPHLMECLSEFGSAQLFKGMNVNGSLHIPFQIGVLFAVLATFGAGYCGHRVASSARRITLLLVSRTLALPSFRKERRGHDSGRVVKSEACTAVRSSHTNQTDVLIETPQRSSFWNSSAIWLITVGRVRGKVRKTLSKLCHSTAPRFTNVISCHILFLCNFSYENPELGFVVPSLSSFTIGQSHVA